MRAARNGDNSAAGAGQDRRPGRRRVHPRGPRRRHLEPLRQQARDRGAAVGRDNCTVRVHAAKLHRGPSLGVDDHVGGPALVDGDAGAGRRVDAHRLLVRGEPLHPHGAGGVGGQGPSDRVRVHVRAVRGRDEAQRPWHCQVRLHALEAGAWPEGHHENSRWIQPFFDLGQKVLIATDGERGGARRRSNVHLDAHCDQAGKLLLQLAHLGGL
mmetsp:Transcript_27174/g.61668  ORF Transcript_27174/g.61668 Transcript_27174/m.61668 type:complete len:212 (+) Transcript_27174:226-861(+)